MHRHNVSQSFIFFIRKLSIKRVHTEIECEETEITDDLSLPVKPSRKISKASKEDHSEESKTDSVDDENAGDFTEETNTEMTKLDKEEIQSPKDLADQGIL